MRENVIVLPGTKWQIPLVQKLKRRGYRVIVLDYYENQPAYEYADEYRIVDILDKENVYEIAKEYSSLAVLSDECDIATPTVAWVSEKMGKPTIGMKMADLYTNKYSMRVFAKKNNFATPLYFKCFSLDEAITVYRNYHKKMIMKPLDGNSSRGVFSIKCQQDIQNHFCESLRYSKKEKCVLLEEYIDGVEFSVDGIKIMDRYYTLSVAQKKHYKNNENLDQELIFRYQNPDYDYDLLRKTNRDYVLASGLEFGLTHAEYKYKDGKYYLIEIGARGGGNLLSGVIDPNISGIESQECLIDWSIGGKCKESDLNYRDNYKKRCAILSFFDVGNNTGKISKISGIEYLKNNKCIKSFYFDYSEGDTVTQVKDGGNRFGYYIACCDSLKELEQIKREVAKKVEIKFE